MQDSLVLDVDDACHIFDSGDGGTNLSVAVQSGVLLDLEEWPRGSAVTHPTRPHQWQPHSCHLQVLRPPQPPIPNPQPPTPPLLHPTLLSALTSLLALALTFILLAAHGVAV